jgi:hypothetical protein
MRDRNLEWGSVNIGSGSCTLGPLGVALTGNAVSGTNRC